MYRAEILYRENMPVQTTLAFWKLGVKGRRPLEKKA